VIVSGFDEAKHQRARNGQFARKTYHEADGVNITDETVVRDQARNMVATFHEPASEQERRERVIDTVTRAGGNDDDVEYVMGLQSISDDAVAFSQADDATVQGEWGAQVEYAHELNDYYPPSSATTGGSGCFDRDDETLLRDVRDLDPETVTVERLRANWVSLSEYCHRAQADRVYHVLNRAQEA